MKVSIIPGGRTIVRVLVSYDEKPPAIRATASVTWPSGKLTQVGGDFNKVEWSPTYLATLRLNGPLEVGTYAVRARCGKDEEDQEFTIV